MTCITTLGKVSTGSNGYSRIYDRDKKKTVKAHRWIFEQFFGDIPQGLVVMHTCDNRACTNINHLKVGTQSENLLDMYRKKRQGIRPVPLGEDHHMTKLTLSQVEILRKIPYYRGLFFQKAKELGVSRPTVRNIYLGKTWKLGPHYKEPYLGDLV